MDAAESPYGKPNPKASRELSQFAKLIGCWPCGSPLKRPDAVQARGSGITFKRRWPPGGSAAKFFPRHMLFRTSDSNTSDTDFTWSCEVSREGGKTLILVQLIDAYRDSKPASS